MYVTITYHEQVRGEVKFACFVQERMLGKATYQHQLLFIIGVTGCGRIVGGALNCETILRSSASEAALQP